MNTQRIIFCVLAGMLVTNAAMAQAYPDRPVKFVVGNAAGGPIDLSARVIAEGLATTWKQSVVVENKPGASEVIGAMTVAKAPADGYTFFFASANAFTNNPSLFASLPYDPVRDFKSVVLVGQIPMAFVASKAAPFTTLPGLIEHAKQHPGALSWSTPGLGSMNHIVGEWLAHEADIKAVQIPYKGGPAALNAVVANEVPYGVVSLAQAIPFAQNGNIQMLAVTTEKRTPLAADVPTVSELSINGFDVSIKAIVMAAAGTPDSIIKKVSADINALLSKPDVQARFAAMGAETVGSSPEQLDAILEKTRAEVARIVARAGIRVQ